MLVNFLRFVSALRVIIFNFTSATTKPAPGHSYPVDDNGRTMPRYEEYSLAEPGPIKCYIAAAMFLECYEPSPAPVPPLQILSNPYISPSEGLPKMPLTTDHPRWPSVPYNGFSPAPSLTLATQALGIPCCRVDPPRPNGVVVLSTPEDSRIG